MEAGRRAAAPRGWACPVTPAMEDGDQHDHVDQDDRDRDDHLPKQLCTQGTQYDLADLEDTGPGGGCWWGRRRRELDAPPDKRLRSAS